ncbi:hypothetical protein BCR35DRAFT_304636 [Leucosporidium creatinivorum]|uniref:Uncharacterized protein n=1 Tax=Leucosporidium creatinivorum TaxID=106004 RepID=A0A1Y2F7A3_9BASI|nr:hypothetical protein BCR35DRAFT_304636 [Leucosporidium creatinivorum]
MQRPRIRPRCYATHRQNRGWTMGRSGACICSTRIRQRSKKRMQQRVQPPSPFFSLRRTSGGLGGRRSRAGWGRRMAMLPVSGKAPGRSQALRGLHLPPRGDAAFEEPSGPTERSKKRLRLSEPKASPSLVPNSPLSHSIRMPQLPSSTRRDYLQPSHSASPRPFPSSSSSAVHLPRPKPTIPPPPSLNTSFLPTLSTFLTSLNAQLSNLASPLLHQGRIDSSNQVMHFLSLSEDLRDLFLRDVEGIGLLERHLLKNELKRARESGWVVEGLAERGSEGVGVSDTPPRMDSDRRVALEGASATESLDWCRVATVEEEIAELEASLR